MLHNIIDEFKSRAQEMGFYDQRLTLNNYHDNMEDELKAAYDETVRLEKDLQRLVTIADVLVEKTEEYEQRIADIKYEKESSSEETNTMYQKMENEINAKDITIK